jgi:hypothetical protein
LLFLSNFFFKPQDYITKAIATLTKIQIIYKASSLQYEAMSDYGKEIEDNRSKGKDSPHKWNNWLEQGTEHYTKLIKLYVEDGGSNNNKSG